ncbi:hypothetical protein J1N35_006091 [Gossypium stocksii]|uniref:Reverse transcriptase zinc-binding domain-containing protein n=1 Tax=Gossypium stocksii TaxID=47602 RepID=A0A9D4AJY1_9ROSI|nr:hypothetical protein J1N35_006091 [Gossypium stocksii]
MDFVWRCLRSFVPTKFHLLSKGVVLSPECSHCGGIVDLDHILFGCGCSVVWGAVEIVHGQDSAYQFLVELLGASSMHLKNLHVWQKKDLNLQQLLAFAYAQVQSWEATNCVFAAAQSASMQRQPVADDLQGVGEQVVTGNGSRQSGCPVPR